MNTIGFYEPVDVNTESKNIGKIGQGTKIRAFEAEDSGKSNGMKVPAIVSSRSSSSSSLPIGNAVTPPSAKKKRGRPPKANSLSNRITSTLNIKVNTSPMYSSPTAENNSNRIVKQGAPDFFTPLMRVSPHLKRKRSRKESFGGIEGELDLYGVKKDSLDINLITPGSLAGGEFGSSHRFNSKAIENISMITRSKSRLDFGSQGEESRVYSGLPNSNYEPHLQYSFNEDPFTSPGSANRTRKVFSTSVYGPNEDFNLRSGISLSFLSEQEQFDLRDGNSNREPDRNLLPPVTITEDPEHGRLSKDTAMENGMYVRNHDYNHNSESESSEKEKNKEAHDANELVNLQEADLGNVRSKTSHGENTSQNDNHNGDFVLKLMVDELGKALLSNDAGNSSSKEPKYAESLNFRNQDYMTYNPEKSENEADPLRKDKSSVRPKINAFHSVSGLESQYMSQGKGSLDEYKNKDISTVDISMIPGGQVHPTVLRRYNSDQTGLSSSAHLGANLRTIAEPSNHTDMEKLPKTPRTKENTFTSTPNGLTPLNLNLNLTPHFNSILNSLSTSPQQRKNFSGSQFLENQELFLENSPSFQQLHQNAQMQDDNTSYRHSFLLGTVNTTDLMTLGNKQGKLPDPAPDTSPRSSPSVHNEDHGDAIQALKRILQVKKSHI